MRAPVDPAPHELGGTRWTLVELDGATIATGDDQPEAYVVLDLEQSRLAGSGGCNRLIGSFEVGGESLRVAPIATTRTACSEEIANREQQLLAALDATTSFEVERASLALLHGARVLARFAADPPKSE